MDYSQDDLLHHDQLKLERFIGFDGSLAGGLVVHPNRQYLIYAMGCNVIVEEIVREGYGPQQVLRGHTDRITCVALAESGQYIASGQATHMGFKASMNLWDFETKRHLATLNLHKVRVEALAFAMDDKHLISLGGQDDGAVIVWKVPCGTPLCGTQAQVGNSGVTLCLKASKRFANIFITGGQDSLRVWTLDAPHSRIRPTDVNLGNMKRVIKCIEMCDLECPPYCLVGTTTGDILIVNMESYRITAVAPKKERFSKGVTALCKLQGVMRSCGMSPQGNIFELPAFELIIGAGDGSLGIYTLKLIQDKVAPNKTNTSLKPRPNTSVWNDESMVNKRYKITSISLRGEGHEFYVGSSNSKMYRFNALTFECTLSKTCHCKSVNEVTFPYGTNELFVTCQYEQVRVWSTRTGTELKRYVVSNMTCDCITISHDGSVIYSGWDDGNIRALGFAKEETPTQRKGDLYKKLVLRDAHNKGVTALAVTSDGEYIISGGGEGQLRLWSIEATYDGQGNRMYVGHLKDNMKEHKSSVSCIRIRSNNRECVSASTDGTTIIWDLERRVRSQIVFANTLFRCVAYGGEECHIVTSGTDRKIVYWEAGTGSMIRELVGSKNGAVNAMDISMDWTTMVTGGDEKLLKVWDYNSGEITFMGLGHSSPIKDIRICPLMEFIISVGNDGAILLWKFPKEKQHQLHLQQLRLLDETRNKKQEEENA